MTTKNTKEWTDVLKDRKNQIFHNNKISIMFNLELKAIEEILEYSKKHKDDDCIRLCKNKAMGSFTDAGHDAWSNIETLINLFPRLSWIQKYWLDTLSYEIMKRKGFIK